MYFSGILYFLCCEIIPLEDQNQPSSTVCVAKVWYSLFLCPFVQKLLKGYLGFFEILTNP